MISRIFNIINNVLKRVFKTLNRLIFVQFIQFHNVFSSNLFDENLNKFDFINVDLLEETLNEIQIFDAIIIIFENV